ncbi:MAG: UpxY family transcription antiterminator [Bacteroides sp.]
MNNVKLTDVVWYALRITYSREIALKDHLDTLGIENFIPMRYVIIEKNNKKTRKLVPVVHNLIFIHTTRLALNELKSRMGILYPIRYIMDRETRTPVVVPEKQMRDFISIAGTYDDQVIYLDNAEINFKKGDRVRITGGLFAGVEGELVRVKGDRRVVVSIQGVMAIATTFIHPSLLEPVN